MGEFIYIVRHGETDLNIGSEPCIRGHSKAPLNEIGKIHAEQAGKYLESQEIDEIWHSPLPRAVETAQYIQKYQKNAKMVETHELIDKYFGDWEGQPVNKVLVTQDGRRYIMYADEIEVPNGETLEQVKSRINILLHKLQNCGKSKICLVSHTPIVSTIMSLMIDAPSSKQLVFEMVPCGISLVQRVKTYYQIKYWNFQDHLQNDKKQIQ